MLSQRSWLEAGLLALICGFVLWYACSDFLVRPALWYDEGITLEIARNFALYGQLDTLTAPGVFSGVPYLVGTNGYPLTVPLAAVFKTFGYGLVQARVLMLLWFFAVLGATYLIVRDLFGKNAGVAGVALVATFASMYGNGLTATGELPGLFFFLVGAWLLARNRSYLYVGFAWGLSMAAKPGVFLLLAHTTLLFILITERTGKFQKLVTAGCGFFVPVLIWVLLAFPLRLETGYSMLAYVLNPVDLPIISDFVQRLPVHTFTSDVLVAHKEVSAGANFAHNFVQLFTASTLVYFSLIAVMVAGAFSLGGRPSEAERRILIVTLVYGGFVLFYFLRGPGWFRYLLGIQTLLLVLAYPAFIRLATRTQALAEQLFPNVRALPQAAVAGAAVVLLVVAQGTQLLFFSNVPASPNVLRGVDRIREFMAADPAATIGVYNVPEVAAFVDPERTYDFSLPQEGGMPLGSSPLLLPSPPEFVVVGKDRRLIGPEEQALLDAAYVSVPNVPKFSVYEKKSH